MSRAGAVGSAEDIALYDRGAPAWWDASSRFSGSLHGLNAVRLAELTARLPGGPGVLVVDLGCGGGLVAEPLARRGARVIGIDKSGASLRVARAHAPGVAGLHYVHGDACRTPLPDACADLVVAADVLEHVPAWRSLVQEAVRVTRPGGLIYCHTLNRTWRSRWLAITLAEGLGLVPRGTHEHRLFVRPAELREAAAACGCVVVGASGQRVRWWASLRRWRLTFSPTPQPTWGTYSLWLQRQPSS